MPRSKQIARLVNNMEREGVRLMVTLATEIHANLTEATPVDTGWARANWVPSIRIPAIKPVGSNENASAATADSQAALFRVVTGYKSTAQGDIWISNNVPYIGILNRRHRTAAGFVPLAIDKAIVKVARGRATRVR